MPTFYKEDYQQKQANDYWYYYRQSLPGQYESNYQEKSQDYWTYVKKSFPNGYINSYDDSSKDDYLYSICKNIRANNDAFNYG